MPDLVATRPRGDGFAVEVKTSDGAITLSARDLDGVLASGHTPVVAALLFPDPTPRWMLLDARGLEPGAHPKHRLARRPQVDFGIDMDLSFRQALAAYHAPAMLGTEVLDRVFFGRSGGA